MKLYEILLRKLGIWNENTPSSTEENKPIELKIYNPIGCKIDGVVKVDAIDFRDYRFNVKQIQEHSILKNGTHHKMVDYLLQARPIGKPDVTYRLRVVPDPDSGSVHTHRAILLSIYDDLAYDEGLHGVVMDDTKKFIVDDDKNDDDPSNDEHSEFWRINDVGSSYISIVRTVPSTGYQKDVEPERLVQHQVEFWDYSRMTDIDGVETEEYVFVEMDKATGWMQVWRGIEVNPARIDVF